jgi:SET domain-containing protein
VHPRDDGGDDNSECDPDLCRVCEADKPVTYDGDTRRCLNISIQTLQRKQLLLGRSSVHGWGAFTKERVRKNELVTEYLGEVLLYIHISHACVVSS